MARKNYFLSEKLIEQRIKDGRGQGYGEKYQPWLRVQDVPSDGRSHRIFSHKTKRIHHLLSDLELATFLLFDWSESGRFSLYVLVNTLIPPDNHDFVSSRRCSFTLNQAK